ncbi:4-hydroxythreonine-4-phosphate dehydrogenase PdxA [Roseivirga sp. E12]|uniref:4-hydroxythreonine-4-phosphate dehydrogenase PdxA n=1 Tax=Roseivirga sp. E12 TaxID=2819237 RepID=UPI001ABCC585|nr:4-hydroxythreonine-4-phosphate dehydrogenase PdxA [Roseivirga sp. E12]MBO3698525.1 4-hydroxythreonine-4-phosphate dehydrogenase PdxA [Roseivirga sp. E12]
MNEAANHNRIKPIIGITIGDINGIGPEVIIKAVQNNLLLNHVDIVVYGHGKVFSLYKTILNIEKFSFHQARSIKEYRQNKLNVINCWTEDFELKVGTETPEAGRFALAALKQATEDLKNGSIQGVVTAPISKNNIQSDDFKFPGHTEYFTSNFEAKDSLMFLCNESLRIGVATGHIALSEISQKLTKKVLQEKLNLMLTSLKKDFGKAKPRVALLGLNPHAGEEGLLGSEEKELIAPLVSEFKEKGKLVFGPYPADGFFGNASYSNFDGVLAMYHDQGLIPFKTIAFEDGVNFTAGLSIVRTSPDHGTAFNIAGKNMANEQSMRSAIYMAVDIIRNRNSAESEQ